ncbi:MAG TPA: hypothetical protein VMF70_01685 [Gemmatimonadales bacterium]|nr:hypothetical protein [Gemmatimonadales bacterium]
MSAPSPLPAVSTPRGTVYTLIAAWALRAGRRRLATWAVGGAADAVGILLVRPGWWLAATPFVCLAAVGSWGLASQREQALDGAGRAAPRQRRLLRAARVAAIAVGTAAAVAGFYGALWLVFGTRWGPSGG